jgi:hypothetical protein
MLLMLKSKGGKMRKSFVVVLIVLMCVSYGFTVKLGVLPEIMKPGMIDVQGNELFIMEGATINVYSLKDLSFIKKFGKRGEGPGELKVRPGWRNTIIAYPDHILAECNDKIIFFSKQGKLLKEKRKSELAALFIPVGKYFVAKRYYMDAKTRLQYMRIVLFDQELKEIKELYRQKWFQQLRPNKFSRESFEIRLFSDYTNFTVFDDKIFIEESPKGFFIEVFDSEGKKLYQIEKEYEKIKVTDVHKKAAVAELRQDEKTGRMTKMVGSWNELLKYMNVLFPEFKPAIDDFFVRDNKIYVQTFSQKDNKIKYIITDLDGKFLDEVYLPITRKPGSEERLQGARFHVINHNKLYYLVENEDSEEWELHVEEIK